MEERIMEPDGQAKLKEELAMVTAAEERQENGPQDGREGRPGAGCDGLVWMRSEYCDGRPPLNDRESRHYSRLLAGIVLELAGARAKLLELDEIVRRLQDLIHERNRMAALFWKAGRLAEMLASGAGLTRQMRCDVYRDTARGDIVWLEHETGLEVKREGAAGERREAR